MQLCHEYSIDLQNGSIYCKPCIFYSEKRLTIMISFIVSQMFFIYRGEVEMLSAEGGTVLGVFGECCSFGEQAATKNCRRIACVR